MLHSNAAGHREPDLLAIRWSRLFDLVLDILEVPVPEVELLPRPPTLHIRSRIEPCRDLFQSGSRIVRAAAKLHYHIQLVFLPASAAVASVCFDGFLDESVKEFVESILPISHDDELLSPLGKLTTMLLLAESLLHLSDQTPPLTGWQRASVICQSKFGLVNGVKGPLFTQRDRLSSVCGTSNTPAFPHDDVVHCPGRVYARLASHKKTVSIADKNVNKSRTSPIFASLLGANDVRFSRLMDRREAPGRKRMGIRSPDGAAPYLLTPSTLPAVSYPVPAHHLRALRVRAIDLISGPAFGVR